MKFIKHLAVAGFCFFALSTNGNAASLDDLYREIIRSDNSGYLPLFVKNRQEPLAPFSEENFSEENDIYSSSSTNNILNLTSEVSKRSAIKQAREQQWLKTLAAVKTNQVTPYELYDITSRVEENDPKAIEILAWMYTKGVGVSPDFVAAFNLYKKAAILNVENAEKNALLVYKSMNDDQRNRIRNDL